MAEFHFYSKKNSKFSAIKKIKKSNSAWQKYVIAIFIVILTTVINLLHYPDLNGGNVIMLYLLGVAITGLYGRGPAILAAIISIFVYNFFFIPYEYSFLIENAEDYFTLLIVLILSLLLIFY